MANEATILWLVVPIVTVTLVSVLILLFRCDPVLSSIVLVQYSQINLKVFCYPAVWPPSKRKQRQPFAIEFVMKSFTNCAYFYISYNLKNK